MNVSVGFYQYKVLNADVIHPTGICQKDGYIYVCDRVDNKVTVFDSSLSYVGGFTAEGSVEMQNTQNMRFDGNRLIIINDALSQIVGVVDRINFYPIGTTIENPQTLSEKGICVEKENIIWAIYGNTIKQLEYDSLVTGTYDTILSSFGSYGTSDYRLNYPDGIAYGNEYLYIADGFNGYVKKFDKDGNFIRKSILLGYPSGIIYTESCIIATDILNNKIYFFDEDLNIQNIYSDSFLFPRDILAYNGKLYITDAGNNRIVVLTYAIDSSLNSTSFIIKTLKSLFPTGRAWKIPAGGVFDKLVTAIGTTFSRPFQYISNLQDIIIPDTNKFDDVAIQEWERIFGIIPNGSIEDRRKKILQLMTYPNGVSSRQNHLFMQSQLVAAGFDVVVTPNRFINPGAPIVFSDDEYFADDTFCGELARVQKRFVTHEPEPFYRIIANSLYASEDSNIFELYRNTVFDDNTFFSDSTTCENFKPWDQQLKGSFFISGDTYPIVEGDSVQKAFIKSEREKEFRELVIKLKPAQTIAFIYVNFTA